MRFTLPLLAALSAALIVSSASAQQPGTVPLRFSGDAPDLAFEVSAPHEKETLTCIAPCTLWVWPGTYRVKMRGRDVASTKKKIDVVGPTDIEAETGSSSGRTAGLVLGAGGGGIALVGLGMLALSNMGHSDHSSDPNHTLWVAMLGGGALVSGGGWILFGASGSSLSVSHPRVAFSTNGTSLSLSGTF